jgi:hypothetical protein
VDVAGGFAAIQYVSNLVDVDGIRVPTTRRAYRRSQDGTAILDELMVSIDLDDVWLSV